MNRHKAIWSVIYQYKEQTGKAEVSMREAVDFAIDRLGWRLPKPSNPRDLLAKEFARAAREEIRHDMATGRPYRANHAVTVEQSGQLSIVWVDIDEAPREPMLKSLMRRREQIIGDGLQLSFDAEHWNRIHPKDEPIAIPMDFTEDVEERKNVPIDDDDDLPLH